MVWEPDSIPLMPLVLNPKTRQPPFQHPVIPSAVIHSDGVREQASAPLLSIRSQALGEGRKNVPIFGGNALSSRWHSAALPEEPWGCCSSWLLLIWRPTPLPHRVPLCPAGGSFHYRALLCHIKSLYRGFYNPYLLLCIATLLHTLALPFRL